MTLEERLNAAEQELAAIRKEMTPKQDDRFVPRGRDEYWYVDDWGDINSCFWSNHTKDHYRIATGNCFRTKEEARRYKASLLVKAPTGPMPKVGDSIHNWSHCHNKVSAWRRFMTTDAHIVAWWNEGEVCVKGFEQELEAKWRRYGWSVTGEPEPEGWES